MARSGQASVDVVADFASFAGQFQRDLNSALRGIRVDMSAINNQITAGIREGVNAASGELRRLGTAAEGSMGAVAQQSAAAGRSMAESMASAGRAMSSVGDKMTTTLTVPIAAAGTATIMSAGNFEAAMNKVKAATETSGAEFTKLRDLAIDLGSTTEFSASEAAFAMNELATAGFDSTEIMGALPGVLDMAAAGSVSLASAAEIASGILNGFGFSATDLTRVNDVLARTFLSTATTLSDLGESFKYVGPTAKSAGLSFTEVSAAIGLMGNAGIKGSMAGTALNASISRLLKPTAEVENTLKTLGVTVTNSSGKLLPLVDILRQLEKSGAKTADMIALFGLEAGPDMMALLSQGSGALADLDKQLQNAGGTAQRVAKTQREGFNASLEELKSAAEGLSIALGDAGLLGWFTTLTQKITELVLATKSLDPLFLKIATVTTIVVAAIGPALAIFGRMVTAIGEAILAFKKFGAWLMRVAPWLSSLAGPLGWVIAGVIALGIAAVVAYNKISSFRQTVDGAFRTVGAAAVWMWQNAILPAFNWIVAQARAVGMAVVSLWTQAQPVFIAIGAAILNVWNSAIKPAIGSIGSTFAQAGSAVMAFWTTSVQPALSAVFGFFVQLGSAVAEWWTGNGSTVMATAAQVVTWFGGIVTTWFTAIMAVLKGVAAIIVWVFINVTIPVWRAVIAVVGTVIEAIMRMQPVWIIIGAIIAAAVAVIIGVVRVWWSVLTVAFQAVGAIVQWLWTSIIQPAFAAIGVIIQALGAVIQWLWSSIVQPVFLFIASAIGMVGSVIIGLWSVFQTVFTAIGAVISAIWSGVIQPVFTFIGMAIQAVVAVVMWFWNTFVPIFTAIGALVMAVWSGVFSVVFGLLKIAFYTVIAVLQVLWGVFQAVFTFIGSIISAVWMGIVLPIITAWAAIFTWLWGVIQPVVQAIAAVFSWVGSVISSVVTAIIGFFTGLWASISAIFNMIVGFIRSAISQIVSAAGGVAGFVSAITGYFQSAVSGVQGRINAIIGFVRGLPGTILGAIGNLGSLLYGAGQNVINGLMEGISSRIGALRERISSAASAIREYLPFSPAKTGPLSGSGDPTLSGAKIISMVGDGMAQQLPYLRDAIGKAISAVPIELETLVGMANLTTAVQPIPTSVMAPAMAGAAVATTGAGAAPVYQITVNALDPQAAARAVVDAIQEFERRNGKGWRTP